MSAGVTLSAAEYFIDTDPGEGSGSPLPAFDGTFDSVEEKVSLSGISTNGLSPGAHHLYIRFKDSLGNWGLPRKASFSVYGVSGAEYFFDADPGVGRGVALGASDGAYDSVTEVVGSDAVALAGLAGGNHTLSIRVRDGWNRWSSTLQDTFHYRAPATVTLNDLAHVYDGVAKNAICTTTPNQLSTVLSYNDIGNGTGRISTGTYGVDCKVVETDYAGQNSGVLEITKASQTIGVTSPSSPVVYQVGGEFSVSANGGGSPNAIVYSSLSPAVCVTDGGNKIAVLSVGTCNLALNQAGDSNYLPADEVIVNVAIIKATARVILKKLAYQYDGKRKSAVCKTQPTGLKTNLSYADFGYGVARRNAGAYGVTCNIEDKNYQGQGSATLWIAKAPQAVLFGANPGPLTYKPKGVVPLQVVGSPTDKRVSLTSLTTSVCTIKDKSIVMRSAGICKVAANQSGNQNYRPAPQVTMKIKINKAVAQVTLERLQQTYNGKRKNASCKTVPAGLKTRLTYSDIGNGIARRDVGRYGVKCAVKETSYTGSKNGILTITKASQRIKFGKNPGPLQFQPGATFSVSAQGGKSGNPIVFTSLTPKRCSVIGSTVSMRSVGICQIRAKQSGNNNYKAAKAVQKIRLK